MFGPIVRSQRNQSIERNLMYGQPAAPAPNERSWAPDRRELRGQLDLVQQVLREGPWYV